MIFIGLLTGLILATWPSWQITKTGQEMAWILAVLREEPEDRRLIDLLMELNFDRHCWRRLFGRDPWALYSRELRDVLRK